MQNTSTAFDLAVTSKVLYPVSKAVLQTADATIYNLGPGDIIAGSLSVNSSCFDDGVELGSTMATDCRLGLNNADGRWNNVILDGATLWPYSGLVLPDTTTEYVKLGTFIIDEPGRPYSQISIQASDRMILLDEPFSAVTRTFPATNLQILTAISSHCNVPLATSITGILNAAYSVTTRPTDDITCRDVVGMIALMAAGFARTNRDGELEIIQLPNLSGTIDVEMPAGSRYEGFEQTSDAVTVTGLTYADTDETVQIGTDAYSLQVDQIPILQDNRDTILQSIFAIIGGYTYTGFACPYPGNPAIDVGDSVRHVTMDGKTIISLISSHSFVHGGQSTMEATAKSQATMSYKGANARRLSTIAAKIQTVDTKLSNYQQTQAQFTDLLTQAMGYFLTNQLQLDGSTIHYEHDHPLLADSVVIYKKTATTMSWTPDAGAHWYGMTAEGNILARVLTAIGVNAEWVHISGASTYASGYDPSTKETPAGAQAKADAAYASAQSFVNGVAMGLQSQIDGSITTFFYAYVPLLTNVPANAWTTTAIKNQHLGDLFYNTSTGYSYRYQLVSTTYSWQRISDTDITTALANAATAQDTADHKRRVFVVTPTTPYDIGDLWAGGSAGDLKRCSTARASGAYVAGDWTLASKYTDDTTANTAITNAALAKTQADLGVSNAAIAKTQADLGVSNALLAKTQADLGVSNALLAKTQADLGVTNAATAQTQANTATTNAATAQAAAVAAQGTANTAKAYTDNLALDTVITPDEKLSLKQEWDLIVSEATATTGKIPAQAIAFSVVHATFDTAYSNLNTYINTTLALFTSMTTAKTGIVRATWDTNWKNYYGARTDLLNTIATKSKTLADTAQTQANTGVTNALAAQNTANTGVSNAAAAQTQANTAVTNAATAQSKADTAFTNAANAQTTANTAIADALTAHNLADTAQTTANTGVSNAATANGLLADLASDSKLTAVEKQTVKKEWDGIVSEVALNDTQATTFGITTQKTTYDNAYSALNTYITPLLSSLTTTSDIVGTTFRTNFKTYYDALTALLNAIANKARTNAAAAQTTANTAVTNAGTAQTQANLGVTNAAAAQTAATNAATVAAAKNKVFYTQPAPPYYIGDIWQKQQVPTAITDIVKCTVTRLTGVYTAADWSNAYTTAEIAAMGSTIISGGHISTSLLTSPDGLTYLNLATGIFHAKDMVEALGFTGITPYCGTRATFADINFIVQLLDLYTDFYNPILFQVTHNRASYDNLGTTHWTTDASFLQIMHGMQFDSNGNALMLPGKTLSGEIIARQAFVRTVFTAFAENQSVANSEWVFPEFAYICPFTGVFSGVFSILTGAANGDAYLSVKSPEGNFQNLFSVNTNGWFVYSIPFCLHASVGETINFSLLSSTNLNIKGSSHQSFSYRTIHGQRM